MTPTRQHGTLTLISFQSSIPEDDIGRKRFRERPIEVFNDTLLTALRGSQVFSRVVRSPEEGATYRLTGVLRSLKTDESTFKFALAPATMRIEATCVVSVRLEDLKSGAVLLDDTLSADGRGQARVFGGGPYGPGPYGGGAQYDSTSGYEESLSQAMADVITLITRRVAEAMPR